MNKSSTPYYEGQRLSIRSPKARHPFVPDRIYEGTCYQERDGVWCLSIRKELFVVLPPLESAYACENVWEIIEEESFKTLIYDVVNDRPGSTEKMKDFLAKEEVSSINK